ncbi:MAG: hypothetical protein ACI4M6_01990 [Christensenellaceae bacterium]
MGSYNVRKIILKSKDNTFFTVAKIVENGNLCKIILDKPQKDWLLAFGNGSQSMLIENGVEFENGDWQNFCVAIICRGEIIARFKQGNAQIETDKLYAPHQDGGYDDEQICDFNYYDNRLIGEDFEEQSYRNTDVAEQSPLAEQAQKDSFCQPQKLDDKDSDTCSKTVAKPYYLLKYEQLERIFCYGRKEKNLENVVANGRFYELDYACDKHYVFGVIYDGEIPKYLTFGIKGNYFERPSAFSGYNCFIPLSLTAPKGEGYYMIFQDAQSGLAVKEKIEQF